MLNADSASVYTDFNGLAKLKQAARDQSPEAIKEVAKQFESVFLGMIMKSMREAKLADGIMDSQQTQFYRDMYDQQMAVHLAGKTGIGFADLIARQLSPQTKEDDGREDKLSAGDYLNRAAGTGDNNQTEAKHQSLIGANSDGEQKPLDASGLSSLERSLALLERSQRVAEGQWQSLDDEPNVAATDTDAGVGKQAFVSQMLPHAREAAKALGVDTNLLLAQAALETGWGQKVIKTGQGDNSFNLFNIKADKSWQGKQANANTLEFDGGVARKTVAGFRAYDSYRDSFNDYVNFIKSNPRYGEALKKAGNPTQYVRELQQAGYATDPRYAEKVMSIYHNQTATQAAVFKDAG